MSRVPLDTVDRPVQLAGGEPEVLRFFPGSAGAISASVAAVGGAPTLVVELVRPDDTVAARGAPGTGTVTVRHEATAAELDGGRPWSVRVRKLSAAPARVVMRATFPTEVVRLELAKLNPMAETALGEVALGVALDWPILTIDVDPSLRKLLPERKDLTSALSGTTIDQVRTRGLAIRFAPPAAGRESGDRVIIDLVLADGIRIDTHSWWKGAFSLRKATLSLIAGLSVRDHALHLELEDVVVRGEAYDRSAGPFLADLVGALDNVLRGQILDGIRPHLRDPAVVEAFHGGVKRVNALFAAQALVDLWIDDEALHLAVTPLPRRPRIEPIVQAPPAPRWPIDHLVVVMMENRSFDHMLGALTAGAAPRRPDLRLADHVPAPVTDDPVSPIQETTLAALEFDPPHGKTA